MSMLEIIQLVFVLSCLLGIVVCFVYNLFRLSKSFRILGWYNIAIISFLLSLVWPLIILYYFMIFHMERKNKKP